MKRCKTNKSHEAKHLAIVHKHWAKVVRGTKLDWNKWGQAGRQDRAKYMK